MGRILAAMALAVMLIGLAPAQANTYLENHFKCTLNEGKTRADLIAFRAEYAAAVEASGLADYSLAVMFPIYAGDIHPGGFTWIGRLGDFENLQKISTWFRATEWPAKFQHLMSCEESALLQVVD